MLIYWFKIGDVGAMAHVVECIVDAVETAGTDVAGGEVDEAILAGGSVGADHNLTLGFGLAEYAVFV